jgi:CrcB protein
MEAYLWIAVGSALGGMARYWCTGLVTDQIDSPFPWGTLTVNVVGSFIIGAFAAATAADGRWLVSPNVQRFVTVGILGGFTTFSALSLQTLELLRSGDWWRGGGNVVLSVVLCLVAVWIGHALVSAASR